jgi:hypothetical protein
MQTGNTGINQVAIGVSAGQSGQGTAAIAIGALAGQTNQHNNSVVINALGSVLNSQTANAFYAAPLRTGITLTTSYGVMLYDATNREVLYSANQASAGSKTFVIDHPIEKDRYLVHGCLEGPEAGIYYRGEARIESGTNRTIVELPHYVRNFGYDFTIQITSVLPEKDETNDKLEPIQPYRVSRVKNNTFIVQGSPGAFFWHASGKRFDIEVEPLRQDTKVNGEGPYKWISSK